MTCFFLSPCDLFELADVLNQGTVTTLKFNALIYPTSFKNYEYNNMQLMQLGGDSKAIPGLRMTP
jgi:hypothetical protein